MRRLIAGTLAVALLGASNAMAGDIISMNFVENATNQLFSGGEMIGPLKTDSTFWNHNTLPTTGDWVAGTLVGLFDDTGAATGVDIEWRCSNTWWNQDGTADDEHRLSVGYLDDGDSGGGQGVVVTLTNIPYANYRIYGLFASDFATQTLNFDVNGIWALGGGPGTFAAIHGTIDDNMLAHGEYWTEIDPGVVTGNYWTVETTGATCVISGFMRVGTIRGSLTAVIIEEMSSGPGTPYCFGQTSLGNPCPCGNDNDGTTPPGGCQHDDSPAGARLEGSGAASVSGDSLLLEGSRGPISNSTLFFQANNDLNGTGNYLGDGIRCAGGGLIRLKVKTTDASGNADSSPAVITARSASFGHPISPGETLYYQWWIRDPGGSPCGNENNTSNGYAVTWSP